MPYCPLGQGLYTCQSSQLHIHALDISGCQQECHLQSKVLNLSVCLRTWGVSSRHRQRGKWNLTQLLMSTWFNVRSEVWNTSHTGLADKARGWSKPVPFCNQRHRPGWISLDISTEQKNRSVVTVVTDQ